VRKLNPTAEELNDWGRAYLPGMMGFEVVNVSPGVLEARMPIRADLLAPNGYLHAASVIALADSACGYGTWSDLAPEAKTFTTIELKSNFLATASEGTLRCTARRVHHGRTTQVWDATVQDDSNGRTLALFRCTQIVIY
jgi:1,4-dihydroxy-2-naphthoyl-CoA hydrolase